VEGHGGSAGLTLQDPSLTCAATGPLLICTANSRHAAITSGYQLQSSSSTCTATSSVTSCNPPLQTVATLQSPPATSCSPRPHPRLHPRLPASILLIHILGYQLHPCTLPTALLKVSTSSIALHPHQRHGFVTDVGYKAEGQWAFGAIPLKALRWIHCSSFHDLMLWKGLLPCIDDMQHQDSCEGLTPCT
jgi:hypothetical protein